MNRLQAEGDFEPSPQQIAKPHTAIVGQARMILDDDGLEVADARGDGRMILGWDRLRVEEVAGVVELEVLRGRKPLQGVVDLRGNGSDGDTLIERVLPQVAHRAAKRTLFVGEEDCRDIFNHARSRSLRLDEKSIRLPQIKPLLRRTGGEDVGVGDHDHLSFPSIQLGNARFGSSSFLCDSPSGSLAACVPRRELGNENRVRR